MFGMSTMLLFYRGQGTKRGSCELLFSELTVTLILGDRLNIRMNLKNHQKGHRSIKILLRKYVEFERF